jgi:hypothetical protein
MIDESTTTRSLRVYDFSNFCAIFNISIFALSMVDFKDRETTFEEIFKFWVFFFIDLVEDQNACSDPKF